MFRAKKPNLFENLLPTMPEGGPIGEDVEKTAVAYDRMKQKINANKGADEGTQGGNQSCKTKYYSRHYHYQTQCKGK
jgi:hypothetical protein